MMKCITVLLFSNRFCTPRSDLCETPPSNSDLVPSVDGSASRNPITGCNCVGFAVVSPRATLVSSSLPHHSSALVALTEAFKLAKSKTVTIYTDLRYAFAIVHDFGALWMQVQPLQVPVFWLSLFIAMLPLSHQPESVVASQWNSRKNEDYMTHKHAVFVTLLQTLVLRVPVDPLTRIKYQKDSLSQSLYFSYQLSKGLFPQHLTGVIVLHLISALNFFQPWLLRHYTNTITLHKHIFSVVCHIKIFWGWFGLCFRKWWRQEWWDDSYKWPIILII